MTRDTYTGDYVAIAGLLIASLIALPAWVLRKGWR